MRLVSDFSSFEEATVWLWFSQSVPVVPGAPGVLTTKRTTIHFPKLGQKSCQLRSTLNPECNSSELNFGPENYANKSRNWQSECSSSAPSLLRSSALSLTAASTCSTCLFMTWTWAGPSASSRSRDVLFRARHALKKKSARQSMNVQRARETGGTDER